VNDFGAIDHSSIDHASKSFNEMFAPFARALLDRSQADDCRLTRMLELQRNCDMRRISNNMRRGEPTPVRPRKAGRSPARKFQYSMLFSLSRCDSEKRISFHMNIPDLCAF
jgi:hypothetical protein